MSQMRRAVVSISSNIAEGFASQTRKSFLNYLTIAMGSAYELDTQLVVSTKVGMLDSAVVEPLRVELHEVRAMIGGLKRSPAVRA